MTRAKRISIKLRWGLLVLWVVCLGFGAFWLLSNCFGVGAGLVGTAVSTLWVSVYGIFTETMTWAYPGLFCTYAGLFFFTQWLFLSPKKLWKIELSETSRPMKRAAIGAGFAVALLTAGLVYSIIDLFSVTIPDSLTTAAEYMIVSIPLVLWLIWSVIFWLYLRQRDSYGWSGRIIRGLIAGSILELFVSIPIFVTRQDDCYCARSSYTGLVFGATALLWAFGPGVLLLFLREKRRIEGLKTDLEISQDKQVPESMA